MMRMSHFCSAAVVLSHTSRNSWIVTASALSGALASYAVPCLLPPYASPSRSSQRFTSAIVMRPTTTEERLTITSCRTVLRGSEGVSDGE